MTYSFTASAWQSCLADFLPYLPDEPPRTAKVFNAPIAPGLFREFVQPSVEPGRRKLGSGEVCVCHGCPWSLAWEIMCHGFKVGAGRHQGRSGVFLMSSTSMLRMDTLFILFIYLCFGLPGTRSQWWCICYCYLEIVLVSIVD